MTFHITGSQSLLKIMLEHLSGTEKLCIAEMCESLVSEDPDGVCDGHT